MLNDKLSVLLVDDNSLLLKAYSALFESTGLQRDDSRKWCRSSSIPARTRA